ncbi:hypothetical protein FRACYDRAFT_234038 [Fragilariopsis cylindrus CCMP1102]|uniref:Uncharacterized protein n=1 Tax=Fragilariopsis cylindrus CCMP1102 TaxID=635003 RepID=A0A1E7FRH8_9STRA|nr:hypothetical protein FRACYDRAFT_234038 [Fragilariopsis cylindrus CCMP1102]|eukprot:OEU20423.1 hypothetical protein FRACYDRAFT_234038 [Fragilariopsis cylindrus CCMP1102]
MKEKRNHQQTSIVSRCRQQDTPVASSSNKYLVYLAIPDALFNLLWPGAYGCFARDYWNEAISGYIAMASFSEKRHPRECCMNDNVYIAYEVYDFVKKTSWICRTNPPSLCKVTIQAIPVYCSAMLLAVLGHFLGDIAPGYIYFSLSFIQSVGIPVGLVLFVCVMIWRCGLLSSCPNIWVPGMALFMFSQPLYLQNFAGYFYGTRTLLCSAKPIVSTCITMTKPDVRKAVLDFFSYYWATNRAKNTEDKNDSEVS